MFCDRSRFQGWNARRMKTEAAIVALVLGFVAPAAAAAPFAFRDIRLGADYNTLAQQLDFRDIEGALREAQEHKAAKPGLGRRGYGCMRRDDPYADITCVSHEEKIAGVATREIRLQFLDGVLQQFSITAEIGDFDAVMQAVGAPYGAPLVERAAEGGSATYSWRNGESKITGYAGKDLVFVSFELASYADATARKQERGRAQECR